MRRSLSGGPGSQSEGRPLLVVPGEPSREDAAVPVREGSVAVVVLSLSLHPALGEDVRELGIPGQVRPAGPADLLEVFPAIISLITVPLPLPLPVGGGLVELPHPGGDDVAGVPGVAGQAWSVGLQGKDGQEDPEERHYPGWHVLLGVAGRPVEVSVRHGERVWLFVGVPVPTGQDHYYNLHTSLISPQLPLVRLVPGHGLEVDPGHVCMVPVCSLVVRRSSLDFLCPDDQSQPGPH